MDSEGVLSVRDFVGYFLFNLPHYTLHLKGLPADNSLVTFVRHSVAICRDYCASADCGPCDALLADFQLSLTTDGDSETLRSLASSLALQASQYFPPSDESTTSVKIVIFFSCSSALACGIVACANYRSMVDGVTAALAFFSMIFCLIAIRYLFSWISSRNSACSVLSFLLSELVQASAKLTQNPLFPAHLDDDGHTQTAGGQTTTTSTFLLEPDEAVQRRVQIDAILAEAEDDEGQIIVRVKNSSKVALGLNALNKHLLLVVTDLEGKVIFWNEGAVLVCGFSVRDAEGKGISSFLFGDKSQQLYDRMTEAALNGVEGSLKTLSLANMTYGSVVVRASVVIAKVSGSDEPLGFVLLASLQESDSIRSVSMFHQYFLQEIAQQTSTKDESSVPFKSLMQCMQWKNLQDLAVASRDWSNALVQTVLSDVIKDRHKQVDVRVLPNVSEWIVCDHQSVTRGIIQTLRHLSGKVRIQVSQRRSTDTVHQLVFQLWWHLQNRTAPFEAIEEIRKSFSEIGCLLHHAVSPSELVVKIHIPFLVEGASGNDSMRLKDGKNTNTPSAAAVPPMTILLMEKNAVYRHNISAIAWASGHSLRVVDSLSKALKAVNDANGELGCAIVDVDVRDADKLLDALATHKIYAIPTSENADSPAKSCAGFLVKPISRALLAKQLETAGLQIKEKKKVDEEIIKQREVFGKVRNSPWTRGKKLGRGAFADVYEATMTLTGGKMAVKMIRLVGGFTERVKELLNEIEILCSLVHPNIIHYFYCERAETTINLFMELADGGSLADLLSRQAKMNEDDLAVVTKQLLLAVDYLHEHGIIHRDIKPGNMLISKGKIKLSDFGTATASVGEGTQGTMFYMAPEVVDGHQYGKECDIWSIGCVMCECLGIKRPPRAGGLLGFDVPTTFPSGLSRCVEDFINLCLQVDPSERPRTGTLLLHDFVVGARNDSSQIGAAPDPQPQRDEEQKAGGWAAGSMRELSVSSGASSVASW